MRESVRERGRKKGRESEKRILGIIEAMLIFQLKVLACMNQRGTASTG